MKQMKKKDVGDNYETEDKEISQHWPDKYHDWNNYITLNEDPEDNLGAA